MADRTLRWFVEGRIGEIRTEVGGSYRLDADYVPTSVHLSLRKAPTGERPIKVNILADGVTIFDSKPAITNEIKDKVWTTIPEDTLREGAIITMNIDQTANVEPGEDLTVELELQRV